MIHRICQSLLSVTLIVLTQHSHAAVLSEKRQHELLNLLEQDCGSCHGMTLQGGLGPALLPANLDGKSDQMLMDTILNGRTGTAMPPWKTFLTQEDAAWLVGHLRKAPESVGQIPKP